MKTALLSAFAVIALSLTACAQTKEKQRMKESRVLVAYFSATGTTRGAAQRLADVTGGTLYEIQPEQPYSAADLDWTNKLSRSSVEMGNPQSRPAIKAGELEAAGYDVVFIGYPIWWDLAPTVVNTFIESLDLKGKTVAPFATSGGSTIANSAAALKKSYPGISWREGKLLNGAGEGAVREWAEKVIQSSSSRQPRS